MKKKYILIMLAFCLLGKAQVSKNINVTTAGTLNTYLTLLTSHERLTITKLTITGVIDARDFKFLLDTIPLLDSLDLSSVNIETYTGTSGPGGTTSQIYPANSLPYRSFYKSYYLKSVSLPNTLISIGDEAFSGCMGLTSVSIPSSITTIGTQVFSSTGLTSITIPSSVSSIGHGAFSFCNKLTSVSIPSSVTTIGSSSFFYCSRLTSVNIPSSVTSIGQQAFSYCTGLSSITIPSSVSSIGQQAFSMCRGLTSVYVHKLDPSDLILSDYVFYYINDSCILHVPIGSKTAYQNSNQWKNFTSIFEMPTELPIEMNSSLTIYQNLINEYIEIKGVVEMTSVSLLDLNGSVLFSKIINADEKFYLNSFKNGIYILKLDNSKGELVKKFIKR